jgi:hypothetical protein
MFVDQDTPDVVLEVALSFPGHLLGVEGAFPGFLLEIPPSMAELSQLRPVLQGVESAGWRHALYPVSEERVFSVFLGKLADQAPLRGLTSPLFEGPEHPEYSAVTRSIMEDPDRMWILGVMVRQDAMMWLIRDDHVVNAKQVVVPASIRVPVPD